MSAPALIEEIGLVIDVLGVVIIVAGILWAFIAYLTGRLRDKEMDAYQAIKVSIGRSLLLGLEILVAADIIKTVALEPNFVSLGVLAALVVIRTFLSWTLVLEIEGRWPWRED